MRLRPRMFAFVAIPLALTGCDKKKPGNPQASATSPAKAGAPAAPGIDKAAAEKALMEHRWVGVFNGKPLELFVTLAKGALVGVLRVGTKQQGSRLVLSPDGRFAISSRPRPTPQGLETTTFSARLKPDFSAITGTVQRAAKQGFVEQSSGLGDFTLNKGAPLQGAPILAKQPRGSFAAALGIAQWDELVELDGKKLRNGDVIAAPDKAPGQEVTAIVLRAGKRMELRGKVPPKPATPAK